MTGVSDDVERIGKLACLLGEAAGVVMRNLAERLSMAFATFPSMIDYDFLIRWRADMEKEKRLRMYRRRYARRRSKK